MLIKAGVVSLFVGSLLACAGAGGDDGAGDEGRDQLAQSEVCAQYLSCVAAVEPSSLGEVTDTYGRSGSCWDNAATARECTDACEVALGGLHQAHPEEPECDDGSEVPSRTYLGDMAEWDFDTTATSGECNGYDQTPESAVVTFRGSDDATFTMDVMVRLRALGYAGDWVSCERSDVPCVLDGSAFTCDGFYAGVNCDTFLFTFTGTFSESWLSATATMAGEDPAGDAGCSPTSEMDGYRSE